MVERDHAAVTRRSMLAKGAVAGGVLWAAPTVLSSPAGAQGSSGGATTTTTTTTLPGPGPAPDINGARVGTSSGLGMGLARGSVITSSFQEFGGDGMIRTYDDALVTLEQSFAGPPNPYAVVKDDLGNYNIAGPAGVHRFTSAGVPVPFLAWGTHTLPRAYTNPPQFDRIFGDQVTGIALYAGDIFVSSAGSDTPFSPRHVARFDSDGNFKNRFLTESLVPGSDGPFGLTFDADGNLVVALGSRIGVFEVTSTGANLLEVFGVGALTWAWGVGVDAWGRTMVADVLGDKVNVFGPAPGRALLATLPFPGRYPVNVVPGAAGAMYISLATGPQAVEIWT